MLDSRRPKCALPVLLAAGLMLVTTFSLPAAAHDPRQDSEDASLFTHSQGPIDLLFDEPVPVKHIYQALDKAFGVQVLFDPGLRPLELSLRLRGVSMKEALEGIRLAAGHLHEIVDERTYFVADDTPQNRRMFQTQGIRTFFLSDAHTKDALALLRAMLGTKRVVVDAGLNALVVRDSLDNLRIVESLLAKHDQPQPEVALGFELIELDPRRVAGSLPIRLPTSELAELKVRARGRVLANPRLVVSQGTEGHLEANDELAPTGLGQLVSYRIEARPRVHLHSKEVSVYLELEMHYVASHPRGGIGPSAHLDRRRSVASEIRLGEGETHLLTGLLATGSTSGEGSEIVLAVTPEVRHRPVFTAEDPHPIRFGGAKPHTATLNMDPALERRLRERIREVTVEKAEGTPSLSRGESKTSKDE